MSKKPAPVDEAKVKQVMDALAKGIAAEKNGPRPPTQTEIEDAQWMHDNRPIYPA